MRRRNLLLLLLLPCLPLCGQMQMPDFEKISSDVALDRVLKNNVLTTDGAPPFHAVMEIGEQSGVDPAHKGRIELFWKDRADYKLVLESPGFGQTLVSQDGRVSETDRGDFYPGWLRGFVTALMNPIPREKDLRGRRGTIAVGPAMSSCVSRDDRPGGITDQMTWAEVCFSGDEPRLQFAIDFTYNVEFSDFKKFEKKQIARSYVSGTGDKVRLKGSLTTLERWKPDTALLAVSTVTPATDRILTTFVSTAKAESMLDSAPKDVVWPAIPEGKLDGWMIVHAVTDRTGQVRETSKHNSDNARLESFGREVALRYKFRPLLLDGVAQQMEMPLVLHFSTKLGNDLPELDDATTRSMITGCELPREIADPASAGQQIVIMFQVNADGGMMTIGSSDRKIPVLSLFRQFRDCHYAQFKRNGEPTDYHANLSVTAR